MTDNDRKVIGWGFITVGVGLILTAISLGTIESDLNSLRNTHNNNVKKANENTDELMKYLRKVNDYLLDIDKRIDKKADKEA